MIQPHFVLQGQICLWQPARIFEEFVAECGLTLSVPKTKAGNNLMDVTPLNGGNVEMVKGLKY